MQKINKLDLNVNDLKEQASKIYDKLSDMDIDTQGIFEKIKTALSSIFAALQLYLDFINLFLALLRLMGDRK